MKKKFSVVLIALMCLMASALAQELPIKIKKPKLESELYTRLVLEGLENKIYAFVDEKGETMLRLYGAAADNQEGYFPIELKPNGNGGFKLSIKDGGPLYPENENPGRAKSYEGKDLPIPNGFERGEVNGYVEMRNFFGYMEYCVYASYDGKNFAFYPTKSSKARLGALPVVIEDMQARLATEGKFSYILPSALENGFSTGVYLTLSDGSVVKAMTDFPMLDENGLERRTPSLKLEDLGESKSKQSQNSQSQNTQSQGSEAQDNEKGEDKKGGILDMLKTKEPTEKPTLKPTAKPTEKPTEEPIESEAPAEPMPGNEKDGK